jgi:hypothetical protein
MQQRHGCVKTLPRSGSAIVEKTAVFGKFPVGDLVFIDFEIIISRRTRKKTRRNSDQQLPI